MAAARAGGGAGTQVTRLVLAQFAEEAKRLIDYVGAIAWYGMFAF